MNPSLTHSGLLGWGQCCVSGEHTQTRVPVRELAKGQVPELVDPQEVRLFSGQKLSVVTLKFNSVFLSSSCSDHYVNELHVLLEHCLGPGHHLLRAVRLLKV